MRTQGLQRRGKANSDEDYDALPEGTSGLREGAATGLAYAADSWLFLQHPRPADGPSCDLLLGCWEECVMTFLTTQYYFELVFDLPWL